ncbi:MAG: hypothetical protein ACM3SS_01560 [Rhodospirillaceae bacterium]
MPLQCPECGHDRLYPKGHGRGKRRYKCAPCGWHGCDPVGQDDTGIDKDATARRYNGLRALLGKGVRRYVITGAQNATDVHPAFFASLKTYCKATGAELIVVPYRYTNPTSIWSQQAQGHDWWTPDVAPYLLDRRIELNKNLVLLADIMCQPTATRPLQGFETITGGKSAILAHPKLELVTIPTPQHKLPKILTTTGSCTQRNYIPSKAGKKADFHHTFGACVIECDGDVFHMRQINAARDGTFMDLLGHYTPTGRKAIERVEALVMGDSHLEFIDPNVVKATFTGKSSMVGMLRPRYLVWNDVYDAYARNHHHEGRVFINYVKHHARKGNIERDLDMVFAFVDKHTPPDAQSVFVPSNHPDALAKWVERTDPRSDPENCVFWARTFEAMCLGSRMTETGARSIDPFTYWARRKLKNADRCIFLSRDESFRIKGIEVGYHGDQGANGARGSISAFGKIGTKTIIGHSHSPGIRDGVYQVGLSARYGLEYAHGPSSWLHCHAVVYPNGKRALLNIIGTAWRA